MKRLLSVWRLGMLLVASVFVVAPMLANEDPMARFAPLLNDSPFLTIAFKERLAETVASPIRNLSFTGYAKIDGEWLLCIHNKQSGEFNWMRIEHAIDELLLKSFDPKKEVITLEYQNQQLKLALEKP
jgi:hypothetical protein